MVASSVVSTILILNYHHRNADTHEMADWVRDFVVVVVYDDDDFFFVSSHIREPFCHLNCIKKSPCDTKIPST